jgi:hypothetical protein
MSDTEKAPSATGAGLSRTDTLVDVAAVDVEKGNAQGTPNPSPADSGDVQPVHVIPEGGWKAWSTGTFIT